MNPTYINKINSIKSKYKEFNRILGSGSTEEMVDDDKDNIAERIEELLNEWKKDFDIEEKQKNEIFTFLYKGNYQNENTKPFSIESKSPAKNMIEEMKRIKDLEEALNEKEEQILKYEQRIEIQHAQINNRNIKSKQKIKRTRRLHKKINRRFGSFSTAGFSKS